MWEQRNGEKGRNSFKVLPHGGSFKVFLPYCAIREKAFSWEDHRSETKELPRRQSFFYFWSVSKKSFCYFRQLFVKVRFCILFSFLRRSVFNNRWESPSEATMMWLVLTNDHHISWETETEEGERSHEQLCYVFKISTKLISNSGQLFFDPKVTLLFKKAFYMTSRWIVMRLMTAKKIFWKAEVKIKSKKISKRVTKNWAIFCDLAFYWPSFFASCCKKPVNANLPRTEPRTVSLF